MAAAADHAELPPFRSADDGCTAGLLPLWADWSAAAAVTRSALWQAVAHGRQRQPSPVVSAMLLIWQCMLHAEAIAMHLHY